MNKWLEDLKQLDWRTPGNWPWPIKTGAYLAIFVGVLVVAFLFVFQEQRNALENEEKKEAELKTTFLEKKKLAVNLEAYQQQRADIERSFGELLKQLPTRSEIEALVIDINQAGLGRGLLPELFRPAQKENFTEFYAETPIELRVAGNYHDLGAFVSDISKLRRIVLLQDLKIDSGNKDGTLTMSALAKTYRYLDPEEAAAQRKASRAKPGAAGAAKPGGK